MTMIITPWTDTNGYTSQEMFYAFDPAGGLAILTQVALLSNAFSEAWYSAEAHAPLTPASPGGFQSVSDIADLTYKNNTTGASLHIWVPAPANAMFLFDLETVDPLNIVALNTAVLANATAPNGDPVDTYVQGYRRTLYKRNYR